MEKKLMREGLACFVEGLTGKEILVELRGNKYISGVLEICDCYFNLRLRKVTLQVDGKRATLDSFFVNGRYVRFIHLKNYEDVQACVRKGLRSR